MEFGNSAHICFGRNGDDDMENNNLIDRLQIFMENEARSCSMDFGCVTPLYVYRMWGGNVGIDEIESAMREVGI